MRTWNASATTDWNTTDTNWNEGENLFFSGDQVVFGDNGQVDFDTTTVPGTALVLTMTSTATDLGGVDEIIVGDGEDFVIAGVGDDRVNYILDPTTGEPVQVGGDDAADYVIAFMGD